MNAKTIGFLAKSLSRMKYTKHFLKKLEGLYESIAYTIRYERGNFNAGYCMVKDKKIIVINKYFDTEGRINCLVDILATLDLAKEDFAELQHAKLYATLTKKEPEA